jgi:UDP-N-acetylmuramate dehydrogenase
MVLILKNEIKGKEIISETENEIFVKFGAGENWHETVLYCIKNNWGGIENLSLIPGTVGAAPIQNIGAYGVELKDVFHECEVFFFDDFTIKNFQLSDCNFEYRESIFKHNLKKQNLHYISYTSFK